VKKLEKDQKHLDDQLLHLDDQLLYLEDLKTVQKLLDTVPAAPLSESDYNEKITEIDTFQANLIDKKTSDYYSNKTQLKSILEDNKADDYIKQFNKLLKSVEITEKLTSSSNVKRAKELLDRVRVIYVSRKEVHPTTVATQPVSQSTPKLKADKLGQALAFLEKTPPPKKK
jgi:hypothetical protein